MKPGRDIISEYGGDSSSPQRPRAEHGGCMYPVDVHNYKPPVGPKNINDSKSPGLHGTNHGNKVNQGRH